MPTHLTGVSAISIFRHIMTKNVILPQHTKVVTISEEFNEILKKANKQGIFGDTEVRVSPFVNTTTIVFTNASGKTVGIISTNDIKEFYR